MWCFHTWKHCGMIKSEKMALILNRTVSLRIRQDVKVKSIPRSIQIHMLIFWDYLSLSLQRCKNPAPNSNSTNIWNIFIPRLNGFIVVTSLFPFWNAREQKFSRSMATIIWLLIHLFLCSFMCFVYSLKWAFVQTCNTPYTTCSMQGRQKYRTQVAMSSTCL